MEKTSPLKSIIFQKNFRIKCEKFVGSPRTHLNTIHEKQSGLQQQEAKNPAVKDQLGPTSPSLPLDLILKEVDQFLETISNFQEEGKIPNCVESLSKWVDSVLDKYHAMYHHHHHDLHDFIEAVNRISLLSNKLGTGPNLNRTSSVLQRAMSFLDKELQAVLSEPSENESYEKSTKNMKENSSFESINSIIDQQPIDEHNEVSEKDNSESSREEKEEDDVKFPSFSPEAVFNMKKITRTMISASYEQECCMIYNRQRRLSFQTELNKLGYVIIGIDDVLRMPWELLEEEITTWINIVNQCSNVLFPRERKLCDSVFSDFSSISQIMYSNIARTIVTQLLNFQDAVVLTKRSTERLFKFLDMYETLQELMLVVKDLPDDCMKDLKLEIEGGRNRIGEAAVGIFCDLKTSIKSDNGRTPVPSGAVHPLTRYIMNYLKYVCEYKDTLEQVFSQHEKEKLINNIDSEPIQEKLANKKESHNIIAKSPLVRPVMTIMDLLDANLDMKSKLYRDPALRYIFLMNNGRYIDQKLKGSNVIHELMGDTWCRKRSFILMQYHKNYQRETWGEVLQCLRHEGLQVKGNVSKIILKDRFKAFNLMVDEIHKKQGTWVVSDEQLKSELRISISAVVIPAYRSFYGRFKQYLNPGRETERCIKYQPEDIEGLIEELFSGNPMSMGRKKT